MGRHSRVPSKRQILRLHVRRERSLAVLGYTGTIAFVAIVVAIVMWLGNNPVDTVVTAEANASALVLGGSSLCSNTWSNAALSDGLDCGISQTPASADPLPGSELDNSSGSDGVQQYGYPADPSTEPTSGHGGLFLECGFVATSDASGNLVTPDITFYIDDPYVIGELMSALPGDVLDITYSGTTVFDQNGTSLYSPYSPPVVLDVQIQSWNRDQGSLNACPSGK